MQRRQKSKRWRRRGMKNGVRCPQLQTTKVPSTLASKSKSTFCRQHGAGDKTLTAVVIAVKISRPRPRPGQGQFLDVEAKAEANDKVINIKNQMIDVWQHTESDEFISLWSKRLSLISHSLSHSKTIFYHTSESGGWTITNNHWHGAEKRKRASLFVTTGNNNLYANPTMKTTAGAPTA